MTEFLFTLIAVIPQTMTTTLHIMKMITMPFMKICAHYDGGSRFRSVPEFNVIK